MSVVNSASKNSTCEDHFIGGFKNAFAPDNATIRTELELSGLRSHHHASPGIDRFDKRPL